jgi:sulfite oxidase
MDYSCEPVHSSLLNIQAKEPFNAEPTAASLVEFPVTPEDLVYCRNHGPVRELDEDTYMLSISGLVKQEVKLSITELKASFASKEIIAALQVRRLSPFLSLRNLTQALSVLVSDETKWGHTRK